MRHRRAHRLHRRAGAREFGEQFLYCAAGLLIGGLDDQGLVVPVVSALLGFGAHFANVLPTCAPTLRRACVDSRIASAHAGAYS